MDKIQNITNKLTDIKKCFETFASCGVEKEVLQKSYNYGQRRISTYLLEEMKNMNSKDRSILGGKFNNFKTDIENIYEKYKNLPETIREIPLR